MRLRNLLKDCRGVTAVEFAIVSPMLILMIFGVIETGRFMFINNSMDSALANSARLWMVDPSTPESIVKATYCERYTMTNCASTQFVVTNKTVDGQNWRILSATTEFTSPLAGLIPLPPHVSRSEAIPIYTH
ncbi:TadE/TadG family type IV pilus assembly protein [Hyphomonas sp. GM-8P]|jgi:Flp pilus assembly protein TadG|uniref:TadE/TadG family type IV pilus assembly protein n=1 Tax=Hyphomonas sp. GM-8P TaxID=1280945 RepID=UPI000DBFA0A6|nr:TadE/TadG family type IV pilus assembly protein [Hyphomonas sp. GM-8P]RAN39152.1 hypothetical protein HY26_16865 [Hyphomonas sp. GM-8P]